MELKDLAKDYYEIGTEIVSGAEIDILNKLFEYASCTKNPSYSLPLLNEINNLYEISQSSGYSFCRIVNIFNMDYFSSTNMTVEEWIVATNNFETDNMIFVSIEPAYCSINCVKIENPEPEKNLFDIVSVKITRYQKTEITVAVENTNKDMDTDYVFNTAEEIAYEYCSYIDEDDWEDDGDYDIDAKRIEDRSLDYKDATFNYSPINEDDMNEFKEDEENE